MKEYLEDVISIKWIAVGVVFYFYSVMLKQVIVKSSYEMEIPFNNWDITLRVLNDMYLIVYFIIPLVLFLSVKTILKEFDYQILIRLGSYKKWVYMTLKRFLINSSPLLFLWVFIALFMMIGFPYSWNWSLLSETEHMTNTLYDITRFFEAPITAFVSQLILLLLTLSMSHIVLATLYVLTTSKKTILLMGTIFLLGSIIGFKVLPKELAFLVPPTYFSLAKGVNTFDSPVLSHFVMLALCILAILFLQVVDLNKSKYIQSAKNYIPTGIYFFLCLIGIISTASAFKKYEGSTIWDVWAMSFIGVNAESFSYRPFFFYLIVFFGFIYLVQLFLSKEIEQISYYKIIRYRNLKKWFWSWMWKLLIAVVLFLVILTVLSLIIAVIGGMDTSFYLTTLSNPLYEVIYHFFINGFLQMVFYIMAVFIIIWVSREHIHGLVLISVFMILMLPVFNSKLIVPVGLNGIIYLTNTPSYNLTLILIIINTIALWVVNFLFKRSLKI